MSSSGQGGPGGQEDKPQGLSRFMRRASKVLKRGSSKTSGSSAPDVPVAESRSDLPAKPKPATSSSASPAPAATPTKVDPPAVPAVPAVPSVPAALQQSIKDIKPSPKITNPRLAKTAAHCGALQEEKARALFAKYGFKLEPGEWTPTVRTDAERIEKKIRLRVHRTCHRCSTTFGSEKICNNCQHTRCKKCPRFPTKKSKDAKGKGASGAIAISADDKGKGKSGADLISLTMPSRATGKELTRKVPMQRVRRTCHRCDTLFAGKATQCEACKHFRCPKCPREPPKLDKYPDGYPGDVEETFPLARRELRSIRTHVRWTCHSCNTLFKDTEKNCRSCSHERCDECKREPPKQPEEPLDEAAVQSIEQKMKAMDLGLQSSASAA